MGDWITETHGDGRHARVGDYQYDFGLRMTMPQHSRTINHYNMQEACRCARHEGNLSYTKNNPQNVRGVFSEAWVCAQ